MNYDKNHRLWSLWEIMNQFHWMDFSANFGLLWSTEQRLAALCDTDGPGASVSLKEQQLIRDTLKALGDICWGAKLRTSQDQIFRIQSQLNDKKSSISAEALLVLIYNVRSTLINELAHRMFLWIDPQ